MLVAGVAPIVVDSVPEAWEQVAVPLFNTNLNTLPIPRSLAPLMMTLQDFGSEYPAAFSTKAIGLLDPPRSIVGRQWLAFEAG